MSPSRDRWIGPVLDDLRAANRELWPLSVWQAFCAAVDVLHGDDVPVRDALHRAWEIIGFDPDLVALLWTAMELANARMRAFEAIADE